MVRDPIAAHQVLFAHRHPDATPPFHGDMIIIWHSAEENALIMTFREGGKSTIAEEAIVIQALMRQFRNGVLLGENQPRAIDRLEAIKHELMNNAKIADIFGDQMGPTWGASKIIMRNGVVLQALGSRQEVRGMKHLDTRPDFLVGDDMESEEDVKDPEARHATLRWFFGELVPALDKNHRIRIMATPLDRESLPMTLAQMPDWYTLKVPIKTKDPRTGDWRATWPGRYPMEWIDKKEKMMQGHGLHDAFMREYMCEAEDPAKKIFTANMIKVVPRVHVWQAVYTMYDPARTVNERSATTGYASFSWIGNKLIVWEGDGLTLKPDEIVSHMFDADARLHPVEIGVEKDGLELFITQPVRHEMLKRRRILPLREMKAPTGKNSFIEGLQPLFKSGEVEFAQELPGLKAQLLSYPSGKIDAPNALAYSLMMRPGLPIYDNFAHMHVVESPMRFETEPFWLALNATAAVTTAVLIQQYGDLLHVLADWVNEGDPGTALEAILKSAQLEAGAKVRPIVPAKHFQVYDAIGMRGAAAQIPIELRIGGELMEGRQLLRDQMTRQIRGAPAFTVASSARWTLNALSAGYCRDVTVKGLVLETPKPGIYATLMEGVEAFAALLKIGMLEEAQPVNWAFTPEGVRYKTILPQKGDQHATKSNWAGTLGNSDPHSLLPRRR